MLGLVVKNTGSWYCVKTDDGRMVDCKVKGNFRLKGIRSTNPVAVGDRVEIRLNPEGTAFITAICDRRNYIVRRSSNLSKQSHILAANVDQALLVVTVNYPETSTTFIDRFLAGAEAYRVPVILAFNKLDLLSEDERRYQAAMRFLYENIGYTVVELSAHDADDVARLLPLLQVNRRFSAATAAWANRRSSTPSCPGPTCARPTSPRPTTRACTPPPSARCCLCPEGDTS